MTIEDDRDLRRGITAFLEDIGFRVIEAENGEQGLEMFARERPDLVLTDLKMPVMDGFTVISTIARMNPEVPVVALSGTGVVKDAVEAIRLGAWDFIAKPINDLDELEAVAVKVLAKVEDRRERRNYLLNLEELANKGARG